MRRKRKYEDDQEVEIDLVADALAQLPSPSHGTTAAPPTYRLKETTKDINSSVICKLTRLCRLPWLVEEIKKVCVVMKQVQLEGWHLANLHVLCCLKEGDDEVPELTQMFFYRCCAATLGNIEKRDRPKDQTQYKSFHETCQRYWANRERETAYTSESMLNTGALITETAKLMEINALNMIALHFRRRLHQYIRFRYARNYKETKKLVDSCYRVRSEPELDGDGDGNPTGKTTKVWTEWDETEDPVELELRGWLKIVPWQSQIRANSAHFVRKLYDMLVWIEKYVAEHPNTKGARLYTLPPVSMSFQAAAYIKLNGSTLHGLFARIIHITEVEDFLKNELDIVPTKKKTLGAQRPFTKPTFQKNRTEILRKVFDVEQFETRNRKFADEVKINGYGASILLIHLVTTTPVTVVEKKKATRDKKSKVKTPEEIAEADSFAKDLFKLGAEYSPDVLIGIDPGMRSLVTAVSIGHLPSRRQKSQRGKHCRRRGGGRRKELVTEISTSEYRHLARMNDYRFYHENLKKREPWYAGVIRAMPSVETSSYDVYLQRLEFFWKHLRFLLAFGSEQAFLRWRFTQDRAKMKALDTLAQRLVPQASKQVCIAYGDWSRRDKIKGHATGPVKGFVEALRKRATVVSMDEYRTSVKCSRCHKRLTQARVLTKVKRKEDETDIRLKSQPSKKEAKEIAEMAKFRNPKLADKMIVLKYTRNVLRCTNSSCKANFWSRDVNAARNMLELLSSGLKGKHGARRLRAFRRSK
ncbi:hypothetical protein PC113_g20496 [Phytophthora cactorum]|uniref:Uncharacterized protein n=3 Tax=Phytophthora cactorum TaxID=29920 RepID=A0A8T0Y2N7_9STRA|nr:hypothetical protein PC112_g20573 [Phytophthora cactorum]KAG2800547.1 hypothetical protein PC111_g19927 [Phytophthora cactorum]KAG2833868.1 hypothetical protein PC113_g20496 [Phytophthora cactorum]